MDKKNIVISSEEIMAYSFCSKKWDFDRVIKVLQFYKKGMSINDISEKIMYSEEKVKNILAEYKFI